MKQKLFMIFALLVFTTTTWAETTIDLSTVKTNITVEDGTTLTGTLNTASYPVKISIADGATVTLSGVTILGIDNGSYPWPGLDCLGDATLVLAEGTTNTVQGFIHWCPGIYVPEDFTLTIRGTGTLNASCNNTNSYAEAAAGIGSAYYSKTLLIQQRQICGNIVIENGNIIATGGNGAAGIGCGYAGQCGNVIIKGGTVTATGGNKAAAIGQGDSGSSFNKIIITKDVTSVTATHGANALTSIGAANPDSYPEDVIIGCTLDAYGNPIGGSTGNITISPVTIYPYTVHFDANSGSGTMADQVLMHDVDFTLTANTFTNGRATFAGWNTRADGTGTSYTDEQSITTMDAGSGGTVTLYAQWSYNADYFTGSGHAGTESDPYLIESLTDWNGLCDHVNSGTNTYSDKYFKLTDNISVGTMVGTSETNSFQGTFDGDGHTLTFTADVTTELCAPFRYLKNATVKKLITTGTITTSAKMAAGIAGRTYGTTAIISCSSSMEINSSVSGDGTHGGLVANISGGTTTLIDCLFNGKLLGSSTDSCGGLIGWTGAGFTVRVTNCLFNPTQIDISPTSSYTLLRYSSSSTQAITNSYYKQAIGSAQGTTASSMSNADLLAALGDGWEIKNNKVVPVITPYAFNGAGTEASPYQIASAADWHSLATNVYLGNAYSGKYFKLIANISVSTMVGDYKSDSNYKAFSGIFDGDGHTLTINVSNQSRFGAPFKCVEGATIKNLHTAGTVDGGSNSDGKLLAGIVGVSFGNTSIIGCCSSASITTNLSDDVALAGIVAAYKSGDLTVKGCVFNGSMTADTSKPNRCGGIVGYRYGGSCSVSNSLFAPTALNVTTGDTGYSATIARTTNDATVTITNCYYTQVLGTVQGKLRHSITAGANVTVENAGTATEYSGSGITSYDTGIKYNNVLYAGSTENVLLALGVTPGYSISGSFSASAGGSLRGSSNPYTLTMPDANVTINANTSIMDWEGNGSEETPYLIYYPAQLNLLATRVNAGNDYSGSYFKVMDDLVYDANVTNNYTAIATAVTGQNGLIDRTFSGYFDGDNHTISGIRTSSNNGTHSGLFGHITSSAEVKNVILTNTVFKGYEHIAGIVGYNEGGRVTHCQVASDVTIDGSDKHGGIVGENKGTVSFCTSSANITHSYNDGQLMIYHFYGGIVGYNSGTMNDNVACGVRLQAKADHDYGIITGKNGNNGTLARNYYTACAVGSTSNVTNKGTNDGDLTENDGAVHTAGIPLLDRANNDYIINSYNSVAGKSYTLAGRTLYKDNYWNTLCLPFSMTAEQVTEQLAPVALMTLDNSSFANGELTLNFANATTIVAGKPYIIKWAGNGTDNLVNPTFAGVTISNTTNDVPTDYVKFIGTYNPADIYTSEKTNLYLGADDYLYYPSGENMTSYIVNSFRAYFQLLNGITAGESTDSNNSGNQIKSFVLNFGEDTETGIFDVRSKTEEERGDGVIYNIAGQRLNKPQRGINIVNGKKVVVK